MEFSFSLEAHHLPSASVETKNTRVYTDTPHKCSRRSAQLIIYSGNLHCPLYKTFYSRQLTTKRAVPVSVNAVGVLECNK
jgi:hypothetical protein